MENLLTKKQAREQGLKYYFTGKPCKRGHVAKRYVSTGQCFCCLKTQNQEWRENNLEKARAICRNYQAKMRSTEEGRQRLKEMNAPRQALYRASQKGKAAKQREFEAREADPNRRAESRIRCLIRNVIIANGSKKAAKTEDLLGCTVADLKS